MITDKIQKLKEMESKAAELKAAIENEKDAELASLPAKYGFDTVNAFIRAVRAAAGTGGGRGRKRGRKAKATKVKAAKAPGRRGRAKITPAMKDELKKLAGEGLSGSKIAKKLGISLPSVHNIKKELGLVKARAAKAEKPQQPAA